MKKYSIIIPTLNEEKNLLHLMKHVEGYLSKAEIIVSDGGSNDLTEQIAEHYNLKFIKGEKGRGQQLNKGAEAAEGEILIFLHADTLLPANSLELIEKHFVDEENKLTTFQLGFDDNKLLLHFYTFCTKVDSIFTTFGDQVVIVRNNFFKELGGFPDYRLYEDVVFFQNARKKTKIKKLPAAATTSARRFEKKGIIKTQFISLWIFILFFLGTEPDELYELYYS